jgi:hypothetical protein
MFCDLVSSTASSHQWEPDLRPSKSWGHCTSHITANSIARENQVREPYMSPDPEMPITPAAPIAAAAERMRNHRERRRLGLRCVTIEFRESELDLLIRWGLLKADARNDTHALRDAVHAFLDRALGTAL